MVNLPSPFSELPRSTLLYSHPPPIEHLKRLSLELSGLEKEGTKFWIKREDSNSGLAFGGNKNSQTGICASRCPQQGSNGTCYDGWSTIEPHEAGRCCWGQIWTEGKGHSPVEEMSLSDEFIDTSSPTRQGKARGH
jgi:hypothetical protein